MSSACSMVSPTYLWGVTMKSYEAIREATGDERQDSLIEEIANRIPISPATLYRWRLPYENPGSGDTGARNPVDLVKYFMEACLTLGRPRSSALAPLDHLNHHFNQICFSVPEHIKSMSHEDLSKELLRCMKEAGDVVAAYQKTMEAKHVSRAQLSRVEKEVWDVVTEFMMFLHCMKESAK